jgi:hypothetical protein
MNKILLILLLFLLHSTLSAQNAEKDAILLKENINCFFKSNGNLVYHIKRRYKILNEDGLEVANYVESFDKLSKISELRIEIHDKSGKQIAIDKNKIIKTYDLSAISSSFSDDKRTYADIPNIAFPFYLEYEYKKTFKGNLQVPNWIPQKNNTIEVISARLDVFVEEGVDVRFKTFNIDSEQIDQSTSKKKHYIFIVDSVSAFIFEAYSPPYYEYTPFVSISPIEFVYDGHSGSLESWEDFGQWSKDLFKDKGSIPLETQKTMDKLVFGINDNSEIVKRVYHYVQKKTRYVSIQYGIGGFQPLNASYVDEKGYGDCKALSFYTKSLLAYLGINSNYTIVKSGSDAPSILLDFPSQQFDHIILNVPLKEDTIWLECTSQTQTFNFLGSFTSDRYALSVGENIGIVKTPSYGKRENIELSCSFISLDEDGNAQSDFVFTKTGLSSEKFEDFSMLPKGSQYNWILKNIGINNFTIGDFKVVSEGERIPSITLNLAITIKNYASISGKRIFIPLTPIMKLERLHPSNEREIDIVIKRSFEMIDSVSIRIPIGFDIEYMPDSLSVDTDFGSIKSYFSILDGIINYYQMISIDKGRFSPDLYSEFQKFYQNIYDREREKLVLVRSE